MIESSVQFIATPAGVRMRALVVLKAYADRCLEERASDSYIESFRIPQELFLEWCHERNLYITYVSDATYSTGTIHFDTVEQRIDFKIRWNI